MEEKDYGIKVSGTKRIPVFDFNEKYITKAGRIIVRARRFRRPIITITGWHLDGRNKITKTIVNEV